VSLLVAITQAVAKPDTPVRKRYLPALKLMSNMFWEYAEVEGFACLANLGGLGDESRKFLIDKIVQLIRENEDEVLESAEKHYEGVDERNVHVYAGVEHPPNVFSMFHLTTQTLCQEYVLPTVPLTALTLAPPHSSKARAILGIAHRLSQSILVEVWFVSGGICCCRKLGRP